MQVVVVVVVAQGLDFRQAAVAALEAEALLVRQGIHKDFHLDKA